jgi:hypothetical protein
MALHTKQTVKEQGPLVDKDHNVCFRGEMAQLRMADDPPPKCPTSEKGLLFQLQSLTSQSRLLGTALPALQSVCLSCSLLLL